MDKELDELRRTAVRELEAVVDLGITPRVIEVLTGGALGYRKAYRWLSGGGLWLPDIKTCNKILDFCIIVQKIKNDLVEIATSWNSKKYHRATQIALYNYAYLKALDDETLGLDEKIARLLVMTFRDWSRAKSKETP
ncbi:hypothetical protein ES703_68627 [subsurface metagenome]